MKRIFIFLIIVLPALLAIGQKRDLRSWADGPLKWSDFKGTSVMPEATSYMKMALSTTPTEETVNGQTELKLTTSAVMDRNASFADTAVRTDQRLRYHQLQFDQLELCRRRLQNDLNSGMTGIAADNRKKYYQNLFSDQLMTIDKETSNGTNDHKLQDWEYYTRKSLDEIGLPAVPEIVPNDYSYGMYLGIGGLFPMSSISDDFSSMCTFTAGLTGGYKRLKMKAEIAYGQPKMENVNVFGVKDASSRDIQGTLNTYASYLGITVNWGVSVYDSKRFTVTPHVGMCWSSFGWNVANYEWTKDENNKDVTKITSTEKKDLKNFNWMAGIDFDIKIHRYVSDTPFFLTGQREQLTSSIRITPYVCHGVYNKAVPAIKGYQVGFTISYAAIARSLRIK